MSDPPKTLPPHLVTSEPPDVDVRHSSPDLLEQVPQWAAELLRRFDLSMDEQREQAEQAHRAAGKIANAFLKTEATVALAKIEMEGCRSDLRAMRRHFDQSLEHLDERFAALEARVAALEAKKP